MVKIWYMDDFDGGDPRLPRIAFPPKYITPERLQKRTGVFLWKIGLDGANATTEGTIVQMEWINKEHKYVKNDILEIKEGVTPRLPEKIQEWYQPHAHKFEESRLVLEGQAYYDVEDFRTERWFRILIERGDFIVIPPGCFHRFTTDTTNHVKMRRFYQSNEGEPIPVSPTVAAMDPTRLEYLKRFETEAEKGDSGKGIRTMERHSVSSN